MMGTVLSSHNILYKSKNQEVTTNNKYPRECINFSYFDRKWLLGVNNI